MKRRICFEITNLSQHFREAYPMFAGLRAFNVSESRYFGLVGCDLCRIVWRISEHERLVFTGESWKQCSDHLDSLLGSKVMVQ